MPSELIEIVHFGDIAADPRLMQVRRAGLALDLEPKALRVLFFLIRNRDRVVTKDELMAEVWAGTFVSDNALTRVVSQIRKQLGDNARSPRYIETASTTGYRFIGDVTVRPMPNSWVRRGAITAAVGVLLALVWWSLPRRQAVQVMHLRQITRASAADLWPTFSPDGGQIAFSSNRGGGFEIYVQSLASGSPERQITKDQQENIQPAWSPDGRYLAYVTRRGGGIAIIPVSGGAPRSITDHGDAPAWSPDGRFLTFRSSSLDINPALETSGPANTSIGLVAADGTGMRALTKGGSPAGGHNFPRFSPDGRHVTFSTIVALTGHLWAVDVQSGKVDEIRFDSSAVRWPVLSPDGAHLYFLGAGGQQPGLWHAPMRGFRAGAPDVLMPAAGQTPRDLALSADGRRLAFSQQVGESALWSISLRSDGMPASDPRTLIQDRSFRNTEPTFSPDGSKIAYSSIRQGGEWAVFVANSDGSNPQPLTYPDEASSRPSWRGKSGSLGYRATRRGEWSYWVTSPGGKPSPLNVKMDLAHADRMSFSPDGAQLVAQLASATGERVAVEDLATHVIRYLTPADGHFGFPSWSRDGRWIALEERKGGRNELRYMPAAGGPIQPLETGTAQSFQFGWSPDSDKIAFAGLADGVWNVYWISRSSKKIQQLTHFTSHSAFVRYPAWSPNGDQIVFENNNLSANIYVADLK